LLSELFELFELLLLPLEDELLLPFEDELLRDELARAGLLLRLCDLAADDEERPELEDLLVTEGLDDCDLLTVDCDLLEEGCDLLTVDCDLLEEGCDLLTVL